MARLIWVIHQQTRDVTGRYHATPPQTGPDPIGALCLRSFELRLAIYGRQRYIATSGDGFETTVSLRPDFVSRCPGGVRRRDILQGVPPSHHGEEISNIVPRNCKFLWMLYFPQKIAKNDKNK